MIKNQQLFISLQTYKGWFFVLASTFILYFFLRRDALKLRDRRKRITELLEREKNNRKQAEEEKKELEEILLEAPSAICILEGPSHRFTYANDAYQQLVGNRRLIGKTVKEALPELQEQGIIDLLDKVYQTGQLHKGSQLPFEVQQDGKKKTYYHNFLYKPFRNEKGDCTAIFVEAVDVSKQVETQKKLEKSNKEKQVLISELHHRVKNNLALITGFIELELQEYQQSFHEVPLETTRNRIFTIAEIHEILFQQQSLKDIPFHDFIDRICEILFSNVEKVEIKSSELKLNINQAVPFGLMINEILSRLKNVNGEYACESINLSLGINEENKVTLELKIQRLDPQVKEKLIHPEEHLPAKLIDALTRQLNAAIEYTEANSMDIIKVQFQKRYKKGASSNL